MTQTGSVGDDQVLATFVRHGKLVAIPTRRAKRRVVLDFLAQHFEPGSRYPEPDVNEILRRFHPDVPALRRYLVDEESSSGGTARIGVQ